MVNEQNLTMRNENESLIVANGNSVMTDPKEGIANSSNCNEKCVPVMGASSSNVINSAVDKVR